MNRPKWLKIALLPGAGMVIVDPPPSSIGEIYSHGVAEGQGEYVIEGVTIRYELREYKSRIEFHNAGILILRGPDEEAHMIWGQKNKIGLHMEQLAGVFSDPSKLHW